MKLDNHKVRVKYSKNLKHYVYSGGQKKPHLTDLLALTYLNRKAMPGPWDLVLIRTEIKLRTSMNDMNLDLEKWIETNLDLEGDIYGASR